MNTAASATAPASATDLASATVPSRTRSRYALVGAGHRAQMYIDAISRRFAGSAELLAWSDTNPGRLDFYDELMAARGTESPARYEPTQLPAMIADQDIDTVDARGHVVGIHLRERQFPTPPEEPARVSDLLVRREFPGQMHDAHAGEGLRQGGRAGFGHGSHGIGVRIQPNSGEPAGEVVGERQTP